MGAFPTIAVEEDVKASGSSREMCGRLWWTPSGGEMTPLPWEAMGQWAPGKEYEEGRPVFLTFDHGVRFWRIISVERSGQFVHGRLELHEPDGTVNGRILREVAALAAGMEPLPAGTAVRMIREDRQRGL